MTIQIEYEAEREWEIDYRPIIEEIVVAALDYEKCPYEAEVNVVLTNDEEIHRINKEFRGIDRATDVLSFPMGDYDVPSDFERLEEQSEDYFNPETGELLLGDIVISIDKVDEQADTVILRSANWRSWWHTVCCTCAVTIIWKMTNAL